jgi:RND family efflux transporter MFP subunit
MKPKIDRRTLLMAASLLVLLAILIGWLLDTPEIEGIPVARVKRGDVRITITESGELRAEHQATVSAPTDKQIIWLVAEGTRVKQGDPLLEFESQKYEIAKSSAESALAVAQADLRKAQSELSAQRASEQKARLDYGALPELAEKGFINRNELEGARLAYEEVRASTRSYEAGVSAARANVERAERDVEQQERKLREGLVKAPRDGIVVYATHGEATSPRKISVGMTPFEGMDLIYLPDTSSMRVDTEISEYDLARIAVGTRAELRLDAYPDLLFNGEVVEISSLARRKISKITGKPVGVKVFDVSIKVLDADERIKPGLTTTVDLLVSENPDCLYVPVAGVFIDDLDRTVVYRRRSRDVEVQRVELGGSTDRVAIVKKGLEEGDEILLGVPSML